MTHKVITKKTASKKSPTKVPVRKGPKVPKVGKTVTGGY